MFGLAYFMIYEVRTSINITLHELHRSALQGSETLKKGPSYGSSRYAPTLRTGQGPMQFHSPDEAKRS